MYEDKTYSNKKNIFLQKYLLRSVSEKGFALPQILILAIGITITLVGLMNASINRLSTSNLSNKDSGWLESKYLVCVLFSNIKGKEQLFLSRAFKYAKSQSDDSCVHLKVF